MSEWHAWQRGLQRPLVRCKLLLVRSIHFGEGVFFFPPRFLYTVRSTSRWSTESPSRALLHRSGLYFANLLFSLGGCTRWTQCGEAWVERGLTPPPFLTQTPYTARKAQRTIHGEMYAKGNDAPSDSLTMFSIHRWCTECTFSQRESAQLFLFLPMPLGSELSPVTVPSVALDPADHLCVLSFTSPEGEATREETRKRLAGGSFGWLGLWKCELLHPLRLVTSTILNVVARHTNKTPFQCNMLPQSESLNSVTV